jgi:hypothetical protein
MLVNERKSSFHSTFNHVQIYETFFLFRMEFYDLIFNKEFNTYFNSNLFSVTSPTPHLATRITRTRDYQHTLRQVRLATQVHMNIKAVRESQRYHAVRRTKPCKRVYTL